MFLEFEKEDGGAVAVEDGDVCALGDVRAGLVDVYLRSGPVVRVRGDYADVLRRVKDPYGEEEKMLKTQEVMKAASCDMIANNLRFRWLGENAPVLVSSRQCGKSWLQQTWEDYKDAKET